MRLFILRHGIAEDHGSRAKDAERALTEEGREKLGAVLHRAAKAGVAPSLILTSPYVRARQTAQMAAEALGRGIPVLPVDSLVPHSSPQAVWQSVQEHRTEDSIMLAGHEPLLSQVVSHFLACPALRFEFRKGAIVAMEMDSFRGDPHGTLEWILTPRLAKS